MLRTKLRTLFTALARDKRGSTMVALAVITPIIVAGLTFGAEAGYWELAKRKLQNAADTAAYAGATQLRSGLEESEMEDAALLIANDSGFHLVSSNAIIGPSSGYGTLTLASPPDTGAYAGDTDAVNVQLSATVPRRFSKMFLRNDITLSAYATAQVRNPRPACVLALHPSTSDAIAVTGSTEVTLTGCDLAANSIAGDAISQSGSGVLGADCLSTVGGVDIADPSAVTLNDCAEAIENAPVTADPYRDRPEPSWTNCNTFASFTSGSPATPSPDCYGNGSTSTVVTVNKQVDLSAGVYIFNGGQWQFTANAIVTGEDVTLYLTNGATINNINGGATFQIKAPTDPSDPYRGLAIFVDRDSDVDMMLNGGSNFSIVGAVYAANANISFAGDTSGSEPGECTQIIGGTVTFTGNSEFNTDCSNSGTTEIRTALSIRLVE